MLTKISPRIRFIAPHNAGFYGVMGPTRAYNNLVALANDYERQLKAILILHGKVPDREDPSKYVCGTDGESYPCETRKCIK